MPSLHGHMTWVPSVGVSLTVRHENLQKSDFIDVHANMYKVINVMSNPLKRLA